MSKYSAMFGQLSTEIDPVDDIEAWCKANGIKTKAKRINYILNGATPKNITANQVSDIGMVHVAEATECNKCVDAVVQEFAEMKESLEPAEKLILEALGLIERGSKGKGLGRLLGAFKPVSSPSETRDAVKARIDQAVKQFEVKIPFKVEPFIEGLGDARYYLDKIIEGLDNTINSLNYLIEKSGDDLIKDLARRRKEMFAKSLALQALNKSQVEQMQKICEQKKTFVEELKMTVIPIIENAIRSSMISGNADLSQISEALKKIYEAKGGNGVYG